MKPIYLPLGWQLARKVEKADEEARKTEKADLAEQLCAIYKQENRSANAVAQGIHFKSSGLFRNSVLKVIFRK